MRGLSFIPLLVLAFFQGPQSPVPQDKPRQPAGIIRGHVFGSGHRSLFRAQVRLVGVDSGQEAFDTTDETGLFEFPQLAAGAYRVSAGKAGYLVMEFGQSAPFDHGATIDVADGEKVDGIDIALPPSGAVTGRLIDENGDPVEGAMVQLEEVQYIAGRRQLLPVVGVASRTSNDVGNYRLFGVPPGQYIVSAAINLTVSRQVTDGPPGYTPIYAPGTPVGSEARVVEVGLSQEVSGVDILFTPIDTAQISGAAFSSIGEPIGGRYTLFPSERSGTIATAPMSGQIDGQGHFTIANVAPGDYVLQVTSVRRHREDDPRLYGDADEGEFGWNYVTLKSGERQALAVQTLPGSLVTGHVSFEDDPGDLRPGQISITTVSANQERSPLQIRRAVAPVQGDWTFTINGLSGPRVIRVARQPAGWTLKAVKANGVDITDTLTEFGAKDQSLTDVEVVLSRRISQITGQVTNARERPVAGAAVVVFARDADRRAQWARSVKVRRSGQNGSFTIRDLPPGDYFVAAVDRLADSTGELFEPEFLESLTRGASKAALADGQSLAVNLRLVTR